MSGQKIKTEIACQNIAPIRNLTKEISSSSLKFGVFANNGSGKTFISRMFRLTETPAELELDKGGNSPTDKLITLGHNSGNFKFKITDREGNIVEQFGISLSKKAIPNIPKTNYLFHVFNEDYVEDNLRSLDYEKDDEIDGYILGKVNIDLSDDEDKLKKIETEGSELSNQIESEINKYIAEKINDIQNIKRLNEYKELEYKKILNSVDKESYGIPKSYDDLVEDYNKIKSVPENLSDIAKVDRIEIDLELLGEILLNSTKEYSLSSMAESFKDKIKAKQSFIELGIANLDNKKENCPFCEQTLETDALNLIDSYNEYLADVESTTIRLFNDYKNSISKVIEEIEEINTSNIKRINSFNNYKEKYIPSSSEKDLKDLDTSNLKSELQKVIDSIELKINDISKSFEIDEETLSSIEKYQTILNGVIESNNSEIDTINKKKNSTSEENKSIRKKICKRTVDDLIDEHKTNIKSLLKLREDYTKLKSEIEKKKEQEKVSRKKKGRINYKECLELLFCW